MGLDDEELDDLSKGASKSDIEKLPLEVRFHLKHKSARNRWTVSEGFPSQEVIGAYKNPQVDKSEEKFSWARPDVNGLRALCQRVLGWDRLQIDSLITPMTKVLEERPFSQKRIDSYFMTYHDNKRVAAIKSKRLRTAVEDLAREPTEVLMIGDYGEVGISTRKRKASSAGAGRDAAGMAAGTVPGTQEQPATGTKGGDDGGANASLAKKRKPSSAVGAAPISAGESDPGTGYGRASSDAEMAHSEVDAVVDRLARTSSERRSPTVPPSTEADSASRGRKSSGVGVIDAERGTGTGGVRREDATRAASDAGGGSRRKGASSSGRKTSGVREGRRGSTAASQGETASNVGGCTRRRASKAQCSPGKRVDEAHVEAREEERRRNPRRQGTAGTGAAKAAKTAKTSRSKRSTAGGETAGAESDSPEMEGFEKNGEEDDDDSDFEGTSSGDDNENDGEDDDDDEDGDSTNGRGGGAQGAAGRSRSRGSDQLRRSRGTGRGRRGKRARRGRQMG